MDDHEHEWIDDSTFGDLGRGVRVYVCAICPERREEPLRREAHAGLPDAR